MAVGRLGQHGVRAQWVVVLVWSCAAEHVLTQHQNMEERNVLKRRTINQNVPWSRAKVGKNIFLIILIKIFIIHHFLHLISLFSYSLFQFHTPGSPCVRPLFPHSFFEPNYTCWYINLFIILKCLCFFIIVDGGWSAWSKWSTCSTSCGPGAKSRSRTCSNPAPKYGGMTCTGERSDKAGCTIKPCPG